MVTFGDDLLSDEEDDELVEDKPIAEVELNSQFDLSRGKSKFVKRASSIMKLLEAIKPEKHELETSEKKTSIVHPALAIEEDDDPQVQGQAAKGKIGMKSTFLKK